MKRRELGKALCLLLTMLLLLAGGLISYENTFMEKRPEYDRMCDAARRMEACMAEIKAERLRRGLPVDETEDIFSTGLLGTGHTAITTTLGNLEAKRTSCQRDMGALVLRLLLEAGVKAGDRVGICASGSFPALNIALFCALDALEAQPAAIISIGASTYGANLPEFTAPEMLYHLYEKGLVSTAPLYATLGGDGDMGQNMGAAFFEEEQAVLEQTLTRLETAGIPLVCIPDRQENLVWREQVYGDIDCFVSIGGQSMAMGAHEEGYALGQGVLRRQRVKNGESFLLGHYLNLGVPVTVLLNVRTLCAEYGLPFDPIALAPIGKNALYYKKTCPKVPVLLALGLGAGMLLLYRRWFVWKGRNQK